MKIFLNEYIHPRAVERLLERAVITDKPDDIFDVDAIILRTFQVSGDIMRKSSKLRVIGKHGTGCDTIDLNVAKELGIRVVYTPKANVNSVAELIVAQLLCVSRFISTADRIVRHDGFVTIAPKEIVGTELNGKTLGLIGMGNISMTAAKILTNGFNMRVIGYDPYAAMDSYGEIAVTKFNSLVDMLPLCDYISLSVPLTESTRGMIGEKIFKFFKKSAILVNTSRGGVVDENALYEALKGGMLRGAACDVFVSEPPDINNRLLTLDNFTATPHIGANTEEALYRMGMTVVDEIFRVLDGDEPLYPVV